MNLSFEKGAEDSPKGHALLYFRSLSDNEEVWATYLVVLPITVDVSKYVPPFLMNQVGDIGPKELSAFAFPPAPEKVEGYHRLEEMAAARDDDILFGGTLNPTDISAAMMSVTEAVQYYSGLYASLQPADSQKEADADGEAAGSGLNEILYGLMSSSDKLSELTRLVGRLRYASEGSEEVLVNEAEADLVLLARHLPENYRIDRLIAAAKAGDGRDAGLADLYLRRCFHLVQEEYVKLGRVEEQIRELETAE